MSEKWRNCKFNLNLFVFCTNFNNIGIKILRRKKQFIKVFKILKQVIHHHTYFNKEFLAIIGLKFIFE